MYIFYAYMYTNIYIYISFNVRIHLCIEVSTVNYSIKIGLSAQGQSSLKLDKDYIITKDDDGLILKLLGGRRWVR